MFTIILVSSITSGSMTFIVKVGLKKFRILNSHDADLRKSGKKPPEILEQIQYVLQGCTRRC